KLGGRAGRRVEFHISTQHITLDGYEIRPSVRTSRVSRAYDLRGVVVEREVGRSLRESGGRRAVSGEALVDQTDALVQRIERLPLGSSDPLNQAIDTFDMRRPAKQRARCR